MQAGAFSFRLAQWRNLSSILNLAKACYLSADLHLHSRSPSPQPAPCSPPPPDPETSETAASPAYPTHPSKTDATPARISSHPVSPDTRTTCPGSAQLPPQPSPPPSSGTQSSPVSSPAPFGARSFRRPSRSQSALCGRQKEPQPPTAETSSCTGSNSAAHPRHPQLLADPPESIWDSECHRLPPRHTHTARSTTLSENHLYSSASNTPAPQAPTPHTTQSTSVSSSCTSLPRQSRLPLPRCYSHSPAQTSPVAPDKPTPSTAETIATQSSHAHPKIKTAQPSPRLSPISS